MYGDVPRNANLDAKNTRRTSNCIYILSSNIKYSSIKIMQLIEQAFTNFKFYRETAEQHIAISELFSALSFLNSDLILDTSNWV